eukprot:TCALIF_02969-PA protein Name:"Similar to C18orf63 Uncharacterized protein C18orf63 (Homo sapiens)" AED:0.04 eAED:0.16 QI:79/0.66/0.71/1/0.83/0.85/7/34/560
MSEWTWDSGWSVFQSRSISEAWTRFCGQVWRWGQGKPIGTTQSGSRALDGGRGLSLFPSFSSMMLTAREFVLLYPDMLAMPQMDATPPKLWLIFPEEPDEHGFPPPLSGGRPMQERIEFLGLTCCQSRVEISPEIFEQCLQFTIQTRMAPLWNRIGPYFLAGVEFLESPTVNFVQARLNFHASTSVITLALKGGRLRFPSLALKDYLVQDQLMKLFQQGELKSGDIYDWKDMRRYWKNMYGIRLKEEREPEFFVNVRFGTKRSQIYSYPDLCVRPYHPYCIPRIPPEPIIEQFLVDFRGLMKLNGSVLRMPTVSRVPLEIIVPLSPRSASKTEILKASGDHQPIVDCSEVQLESPGVDTSDLGLSCLPSQFKLTIPASFKSPQSKGAHPKLFSEFQSVSKHFKPASISGTRSQSSKKSFKFDEMFKPASAPRSNGDGYSANDTTCPFVSGSIIDKFMKNSKSIQVGPEPQPKVAESAMSQVVRSKPVKRGATSTLNDEEYCLNKRPRTAETSVIIGEWLQQRNLNPDAFCDNVSRKAKEEELQLSPNLLNEIFDTSLNEP